MSFSSEAVLDSDNTDIVPKRRRSFLDISTATTPKLSTGNVVSSTTSQRQNNESLTKATDVIFNPAETEESSVEHKEEKSKVDSEQLNSFVLPTAAKLENICKLYVSPIHQMIVNIFH